MEENKGQARDTFNWLRQVMKPITIKDIEPKIHEHLDAIKAYFEPGAKVTLVLRNPEYGDDAGVVVTDEANLEDAIAELRRNGAK